MVTYTYFTWIFILLDLVLSITSSYLYLVCLYIKLSKVCR